MNTHLFFSRHYNISKLIIIALVTAVFSIFGVITVNMISSNAKAANNSILSYRSVAVMANDTLWSIAKENYTEDCGSFEDYLEDIMRCNSLSSDQINSGCSLLVPIYITIP